MPETPTRVILIEERMGELDRRMNTLVERFNQEMAARPIDGPPNGGLTPLERIALISAASGVVIAIIAALSQILTAPSP